MTRGLVSVVLGMLGMFLAFAGLHLWTDHKFVDAIRVDLERQRLQQMQRQPEAKP